MSDKSFWTKHSSKVATVLGVAGAIMVGVGIYFVVDYEHQQARQELLGVWEESNVATYAANTLHVAEEGIYWNEDLISTHFAFDGETLEFNLGSSEQRYHLDRLRGTLVHLNGSYKAKYLKQSSKTYAFGHRARGR
ncbi:DUF2850 domain-containing protein [Vibrio coralliilyticus]|uniref:DUF2850 domain-containing protein n=1 Tax=Vibrio coralliilyticus TaxID=190893 RepID=A0AAP6ZQY2_9VIBR|nr:DUF2850 domain-containing protein [Vibrio coralliilyticus]NOJ22698.1 DUF2850 domain-containing protein [Vibrio coralliilyticus]